VKLTAYTVFDFPGGGVMGRTGISGDEDVIISPSGKYLLALSLRVWRLYRLPRRFETERRIA
jgi:hypothetical protein